MGLTMVAMLLAAPSWQEVCQQIQAQTSVQGLATLQSKLGARKDRVSRVGSAVCLYYLDIADRPSGNPAEVLWSTIDKNPTAEELLWRWKISRNFREPDLGEPTLKNPQFAVVEGKVVPVYTIDVFNDPQLNKRSELIAAKLHRLYPGTPEDRYIGALQSKEVGGSLPTLYSVFNPSRLWSTDVQWSIENRSSMTGSPDKSGRKRLDHRSVIYKIRFGQ